MKTISWIGIMLAATLLAIGCAKSPPSDRAEPAQDRAQQTDIPPVPEEPAPPVPAREKLVPEASAAGGSEESKPATEGTEVAEPKMNPEAAEPSPTGPAEAPPPAKPEEKPTVLKAIGKALFRSLTSEPGSESSEPSEAPTFRPNR